ICELVKQECALMEPQDVMWKADMYCATTINGVWERGQICCDVTSSTAEVFKHTMSRFFLSDISCL
ncbi:hypothetical protein XENORESO_019370, partial [Xenotaenia resolanae]